MGRGSGTKPPAPSLRNTRLLLARPGGDQVRPVVAVPVDDREPAEGERQLTVHEGLEELLVLRRAREGEADLGRPVAEACGRAREDLPGPLLERREPAQEPIGVDGAPRGLDLGAQGEIHPRLPAFECGLAGPADAHAARRAAGSGVGVQSEAFELALDARRGPVQWRKGEQAREELRGLTDDGLRSRGEGGPRDRPGGARDPGLVEARGELPRGNETACGSLDPSAHQGLQDEAGEVLFEAQGCGLARLDVDDGASDRLRLCRGKRTAAGRHEHREREVAQEGGGGARRGGAERRGGGVHGEVSPPGIRREAPLATIPKS